MGRVTNWEHPDGAEATTTALATALQPFSQRLVEANIQIYPSTDFKVGLNMEILTANSDMMLPLVNIDNRGGIFGQSALTEALRLVVRSDNLELLLTAKTLIHNKTMDETLALMAYKVRVMLSHVRVKFDSHVAGTACPPGFDKIFETMSMPRPTTSRRTRRMERLSSRPNPFLHFRAEDTSQEELDEEDTLAIVSKYFDGKVASRKMAAQVRQTSASQAPMGS